MSNMVLLLLQLACISQDAAVPPVATPSESAALARCLDAPGGAREHIAPLDAGRALVAERRVGDRGAAYHLRVESFAGQAPVELGRFRTVPPVVAADAALAVASAPLPPGADLRTRTRGARLTEVGALVATGLGGGAARTLSAPGHDVTSFVVVKDRALYAAGFSLWEVPLQGGAVTERARQVVEVLAAAEDGTLVASVVGDNALVLARLSPDGQRSDLGVHGQIAAVVGDQLYSQDLPGDPIYMAPLSGGPATPLPEARPGDRLLAQGHSAALWRPRDGGGALIPLGGAGEPLRISGASGRAFVRTDAGGLVLVAHDTDANGQIEGLDEADLCRLDPGQVELSVSPRTLPQSWTRAMASMEPKLDALGLKVQALRVVDGGAVTTLRFHGAGPDSLGGLGDVARHVREALPTPSDVYVQFADSGRFAAIAAIDGVEQRRAGLADVVVWTRPGDLALEVRGFTVTRGERACAGEVRNVGPNPIALISSCGPYYGFQLGFGWIDGPPAAYRVPVDPSPLPPGAAGRFSVLAEGPDGVLNLSPRFLDNDAVVPALNIDQNQASERLFQALTAITSPDGLGVGEHLEDGLGFGGFTSGSSVAALRVAPSWQATRVELRAPADRAADSLWRDALATRAEAELAKLEPAPELWLRSGTSLWMLDHGVFVPRASP